MGSVGFVQPDNAEALVRRCVREGEIADLGQLPPKDREIRAALVRELLLEADRSVVDARGVYLRSARVSGELNLQDCSSELALTFDHCDLTDVPCFDNAALGALRFRNHSSLPGMMANGLHLRGGLDVAGSNVSGPTRLKAAVIGGDLSFVASTLQAAPEAADAIDASFCSVAGGVFLSGQMVDEKYQSCSVSGSTNLVGARVAGRLDCAGVSLDSGGAENQVVLNADGSEIGGGVFLRGVEPRTGKACPFRIVGTVRLVGSRVGVGLYCYAANIATVQDQAGEQKAALILDFAEVSGSVVFRGVFFVGGGTAYCDFGGDVSIRNCRIAGDFRCSGAHLRRHLNLNGARISGDTRIDALWEGQHPELESEICGSLILRGTTVEGELNLREAKIMGQAADLRGCEAARLVDGVTQTSLGCWESVPELLLQGFRYQDLGVDSSTTVGHNRSDGDTWDVDGRIKWLRDKTTRYHAQPWDQLQQLYRRNGYDQAIRRVGIAKEKSRPKDGFSGQWAWRKLLGITIGYGYKPWWAGVWALLMIIVLTAFVWLGRGSLTYVGDVKPPPSFGVDSAVYYATDTFLPIGDFGVARVWNTTGWLEAVRFFFVGMGWLLISLFAVGVTGVIRH
jgi:hypothetical protein